MAGIGEYETLYIVTPELADADLNKAVESLNEIVTKNGGEIVKSDVWGRRRLAYTVKKKDDGTFVLLRFKGAASIPGDLDVYIRRTPDVLRHLTTEVSKQQVKEEARLRALQNKREEEARVAAEEAAKRAADAETAAAQVAADAAAAEAAAPPVEEPAVVAEVAEEPVEAVAEEAAS